jgi:hypothetical protein
MFGGYSEYILPFGSFLGSISIARLCAFASFTEPFRWPSALPGAASGKLFQALNGGSQRIPFGFEFLNDPVEVQR